MTPPVAAVSAVAVDFDFTPDQQMLADAVAEFVRVGATWEFHDQGRRRARWVSSDDVAVRESCFVATGRATGRTVEGRMIQRVTLRDGLIARIVPYYWDTATYAEACTAPESEES